MTTRSAMHADMQHKQIRAAHALRVLAEMDKRKAQETLDEAAELALRQAEDTICGMRAADLLQAFRSWRDSGVQSVDPTGGPVRNVASGRYEDNAMTSRRHGR